MIYFAYPGDLDTASGGYHYDRRLIREMRSMGVEVETLALPLDSLTPNRETLDDVQHHMAALPDQSVVIIDGLAFGVLDEMAANEAQRLRMVALCHHPLALETGLVESQRQALMASERRALHNARATVVTSEHTRQILIDTFALPAGRVTVARPGTERVPFAACKGDPLKLLSVASLTRRKAHDVLIEALAMLQGLPWEARFVGGAEFDPDWASSLRERVSALGLAERIEFTGTRENIQLEYQRADIFVLPSRFEGYGMVFAEALAAGLPIVAARSGAVPDVVPATAGLLVDPDDTEALGGALRQMLTSESMRRQLQAGAQKAAEALPSWGDAAATVAAVLEEVRKG